MLYNRTRHGLDLPVITYLSRTYVLQIYIPNGPNSTARKHAALSHWYVRLVTGGAPACLLFFSHLSRISCTTTTSSYTLTPTLLMPGLFFVFISSDPEINPQLLVVPLVVGFMSTATLV